MDTKQRQEIIGVSIIVSFIMLGIAAFTMIEAFVWIISNPDFLAGQVTERMFRYFLFMVGAWMFATVGKREVKKLKREETQIRIDAWKKRARGLF